MKRETITNQRTPETEEVLVRSLRPADLSALVEIDSIATGRQRPLYFEHMVARSVEKADFQVSLAAELDGKMAGFILATLFYGEYGLVEPWASIEAISVRPECRGKGVGRALMRQLRRNLSALHIEHLRTEVAWNDFDLLGFFERSGFVPAGRICLELELDPTAPEG